MTTFRILERSPMCIGMLQVQCTLMYFQILESLELKWLERVNLSVTQLKYEENSPFWTSVTMSSLKKKCVCHCCSFFCSILQCRWSIGILDKGMLDIGSWNFSLNTLDLVMHLWRHPRPMEGLYLWEILSDFDTRLEVDGLFLFADLFSTTKSALCTRLCHTSGSAEDFAY